jgi:hypothetical protein
MIRFQKNLIINRPVTEVFAFITEPQNDLQWKAVVKEASPSNGPMAVGTTWRQVVEAPGGEAESIEECTEYEMNHRFAQYCPSPFPHGGSYTFEPSGDSTRLHVSGYVKLSGMLKWLQPLVALMVKRAAAKDAAQLKTVLERRMA